MRPVEPGWVVWFTGLPSSGKSTLAARVRQRLAEHAPVALLDGDAVRAALVPPPGYDATARADFYATLSHLAALLAAEGLVVLVAATAHRRAFRDDARAEAPRFLEVYVATPLEECRRRDTKGLYAASPTHLPGAGEQYEPPILPEVVARGGNDERAVEEIARAVLTAGSGHASPA